jgi:hypothetical protein
MIEVQGYDAAPPASRCVCKYESPDVLPWDTELSQSGGVAESVILDQTSLSLSLSLSNI